MTTSSCSPPATSRSPVRSTRCSPHTTASPDPAGIHPTVPATQTVIEARHLDKQTTLLVRTDDPILDPAWTVTPVSLDDIILAYMRQARDDHAPSNPRLTVAR